MSLKDITLILICLFIVSSLFIALPNLKEIKTKFLNIKETVPIINNFTELKWVLREYDIFFSQSKLKIYIKTGRNKLKQINFSNKSAQTVIEYLNEDFNNNSDIEYNNNFSDLSFDYSINKIDSLKDFQITEIVLNENKKIYIALKPSDFKLTYPKFNQSIEKNINNLYNFYQKNHKVNYWRRLLVINYQNGFKEYYKNNQQSQLQNINYLDFNDDFQTNFSTNDNLDETFSGRYILKSKNSTDEIESIVFYLNPIINKGYDKTK